jgi:hypothetical protein
VTVANDTILKADIRSVERSRVRMDSNVRYMKQLANCRIINISRKGLAVELYTAFHAATGSTIQVENDEIGLLEGIICWNKGGRLGIQFRQNSKSIAQVTAYFRHFHHEIHPVLKS